jgi:hypothetical protein
MRTSTFNKALCVAFESEVYQKIKTITDQKKISMAEWVRTAVQKVLEMEKLNATEDQSNFTMGGHTDAKGN